MCSFKSMVSSINPPQNSSSLIVPPMVSETGSVVTHCEWFTRTTSPQFYCYEQRMSKTQWSCKRYETRQNQRIPFRNETSWFWFDRSRQWIWWLELCTIYHIKECIEVKGISLVHGIDNKLLLQLHCKASKNHSASQSYTNTGRFKSLNRIRKFSSEEFRFLQYERQKVKIKMKGTIII